MQLTAKVPIVYIGVNSNIPAIGVYCQDGFIENYYER